MLQGRLELQPGGGYHQPQRGIGQGHPLDVNKGQQQGARGGKPLFAAQHDARNQRVHRQHAGGEGDTNANQQRPQGGEGQTSGDVCWRRHGRRLRHGVLLHRARFNRQRRIEGRAMVQRRHGRGGGWLSVV